MSNKIAPDTLEPNFETIEVGQWHWIEDEDGDQWFACITHIGSNYVQLECPNHFTRRIHFNDFVADLELKPEETIDIRVKEYRDKVQSLVGKVKAITARLGVAPSVELEARNDTPALVKATEGQTYDDYKTALIKAQKDDLPELFSEIKRANEGMARWMSAALIPIQAQARGLETVIKNISNRVFNVELYAGLSEKIVQFVDGEPAPLTTKIHLLQRRCYMDEECLARYKTGGMTFNDIGDFDRWIAEPENRDRLLPFPRCVVAFRVRRDHKHYEIRSFIDFFNVIQNLKDDETTFLYIRNGERLYRMNTSIDFGGKLFPDLKRGKLEGPEPLWARMSGDTPDNIISQGEYDQIRQDYEQRVRDFEVKDKAYQEALNSPAARKKAKELGRKKPDSSCIDVPWPGSKPHWYDRYESFTQDSVYYDDILAKVKGEIDHHNRVALVLQGLLDRSPVFHPHPPWKIWEDSGFEQALELVYDESRALVVGDAPDFEAYRQRLNRTLKEGSVTVGQQKAWLRAEAVKENARRDRDYRRTYQGAQPLTTYKPYGNPGPGYLATIHTWTPRSRKATFVWERERRRPDAWGDWPNIPTQFTCTDRYLLNVDAYTPGDFRQFFEDPRTRAQYLKWAPYLLAAEEYHAGNREKLDDLE